jgi:hypothetical protein
MSMPEEEVQAVVLLRQCPHGRHGTRANTSGQLFPHETASACLDHATVGGVWL